MDNKELLYYTKEKISIWIYILFIFLLIIITYLSYNTFIYNSKEIVGINECIENNCGIKFTLTYDEIDILKENPIMIYHNKKYKIEDIIYNDPYLSNGIPVEDVEIKTTLNTEEQIVNFRINYKKQRIITKIKENIIERK